MTRAAVSTFLISALALGAVACGDHEAEPTRPTFDFTPVATIAVSDDGISCSVVGGSEPAEDGGCKVESGSVLSVQNTDGFDHRLVGADTEGNNVFDTGEMQPGDDMTLVLTDDPASPRGPVTVTDSLWPHGDSPTIEITVTPAPANG